MDKELAFILFGSAICIASSVGVFFIIRSNRRLENEQKKEEAKKMAQQSWPGALNANHQALADLNTPTHLAEVKEKAPVGLNFMR